ncbi:hypothetical protein [Azospirillum largimobile]
MALSSRSGKRRIIGGVGPLSRAGAGPRPVAWRIHPLRCDIPALPVEHGSTYGAVLYELDRP